VHCDACLGSGHQLAWLTLQEDERWEIAVPDRSPIVVAHPALRQCRPMAPQDLVTMSVLVERHREGPLALHELDEPDRETVRRRLADLDPRRERVRSQQYLKLAAIRRDVTFEMCGARATLSLTGTQLIGATTPEVLRPIRRRLYAWITLCGLVGLAGLALRGSVLGRSSYFQSANNAAVLLVIAAVGCAIPALGALLRSWRGGLRLHPIRRATKIWSAGVGFAFVAILALGLVVRPDPAEAQRALAVNDVARAREVVRALIEQTGATPELRDIEDRVMLAEASRLADQDRLKLLDTVAAHKGAAASGAAADARAQRLEQVRQLIAARHPADALRLLDQEFGDDRSDVIAEVRASAHDAALAACTAAACELVEAGRARDARTTPGRVAAFATARAHAVAAVAPEQVTAKQVLPRLQQLRQLRDSAMAIAQVSDGDPELQAHARKAFDLAEAARAAVPLLGNDQSVAEELLGPSTLGRGGAPSIDLGGVTVFLSVDPKGRCTGVYVVGEKAADREIKSGTWPPARLLSQAVGRASTLQTPSGSQPTTRWYVGGAPVVVRWYAGAPIEMRIGDATP
jgi:hypothetical protein